jgi:hypothetical protein
MSINLVLHSTDAISYANGTAEFYVNWNNFYEDDPYCSYNLSFSFQTEMVTNAVLTATDLYSLNLENFGTTFRTIEGAGTDGNSNNSLSLGFLETREQHLNQNYNSNLLRTLVAYHSTNPPVTIQGRPNSSMIQVTLRDFSKAKAPATLTPEFMLFLRFEKI